MRFSCIANKDLRIPDLPSGPIREIKIDCPVHRKCIGPYIDVAAQIVFHTYYGRCLCLDCIPSQITLQAWHLYWAMHRKPDDENS